MLKFDGNSAVLITKEAALLSEKSKVDISVKEYTSKKSNIIKTAKDLVTESALLKEKQAELLKVDYSKLDILSKEIENLSTDVLNNNSLIKLNLLKIEELSIPLPDDDSCKHCRQPMTKEHRAICENSINNELIICKNIVKNTQESNIKLNNLIAEKNKEVNSLNLSKQKFEDLNLKISSINKEIKDKKDIHIEYSNLLNKFTEEAKNKETEILNIKEQISNSSISKVNELKEKIISLKSDLSKLDNNISDLRNELTILNNNKAVTDHNIIQKTKDYDLYKKYNLDLDNLRLKHSSFPDVIKAFSSIGIPNLIIQNVLDDLQIEANNLLAQLKPGLQLSFSIEKIKADGTEVDTLDINYSVNR